MLKWRALIGVTDFPKHGVLAGCYGIYGTAGAGEKSLTLRCSSFFF